MWKFEPSRVEDHGSGFTLLEIVLLTVIIGVMSAIAAPSVAKMLERVKLDRAIVDIRGALQETQRQAMRENRTCSVTLNLIEAEVSGPCLTTGTRSLPQNIEIATNLTNGTGAIATSGVNAAEKEHPEATPVAVDTYPNLGLTHLEKGTKIAMLEESSNLTSSSLTDISNAGIVIHIIAQANETCSSGSLGIKNCDHQSQIIPVKYGKLGSAYFTIATALESPNVPLDPSGKLVLFLKGDRNTQKKCIAISQTLGLTRTGVYTGAINPSDITDTGICSVTDPEAQ